MDINIRVSGMTCGSCAVSLEKKLMDLPGVAAATVNFATSLATVTLKPKRATTSPVGADDDGADGAGVLATRQSVEAGIVKFGYKVLREHYSHSTWKVKGMTCGSCANFLEDHLMKVPGVVSATVNFATCSAAVQADPEVCPSSAVRRAVVDAGYDVEESGETTVGDTNGEVDLLDRVEEKEYYLRRLIVAILLSIPIAGIMVAEAAGSETVHSRRILFGGIQAGLATPCVLYSGIGFFIRAFTSLRHFMFTMDTLVAVGVGGVYIASIVTYALTVAGTPAAFYFDTAGLLVSFMTLGKYLEALAKSQTCSALTALMKLAPDSAHLVTETDVLTIKATELRLEDVFRVYAGEKMPADGIVFRGSSDVDENLLTGESIPKVVEVGSEVIGGTLNLTSTLDVTATRVGSATTLSKIVKIVEDAQSAKPRLQQVADQIASVFVPVVIIGGVAVLAVWLLIGGLVGIPEAYLDDGEGWGMFAFNRFLATIVVACPCALGLATPTAILVGTSIGARRGILAKSGVVLEAVANITHIIFDKTGTLTTGSLRVINYQLFDLDGNATGELTPAVLQAIVAVEMQSTHPIARAVTTFAQEKVGEAFDIPEVSDSTTIPGRGISASIGGITVSIGSANLAVEAVASGFPAAMTDYSKTPLTKVYIVYGGALVAVLLLQDEVRDEAKVVVEYFHNLGKTVMMVSGDNEHAAQAVADQVGIPASCVFAGRLPGEKVDVVASVQQNSGKGNVVCFVGDGINDAPALAQAHVGVAIGAGTDVAIETAEAVLMRSSLLDLPTLYCLSEKVVLRIKLNLLWACAYNVVMIPFAAGIVLPIADVKLPPLYAGGAMALSSLTVVCSSLLLQLFTPPIADLQ